MRKILLLTTLLFVTFLSFGQCPGQFTTFNSQAQIDQFAADYPDCTLLTNDLSIGLFQGGGETDITNLDGLSQLQGVTGSQRVLIQSSPLLTSIEGLSGMTEMGRLSIGYCASLTSLAGLENLTSIHQSLRLSNLPQLTSLDGLQNVTISGLPTFFQSVQLDNLPQITSLDGLLAPGSTLQGGISFQNMSGLQSLNGMENITAVDGIIFINENPNLQSLGGLESVSGTIGGILLRDNDALTDISALSNVTGLSGLINETQGYYHTPLSIENNDALVELTGLENFVSVLESPDQEGYLIADNDLLSDIGALSSYNFSSISEVDLTITNNSSLGICTIGSICELLENSGNATILIEGNSQGCNTEPEVIAACGVDVNIVSGGIKFDFDADGCDLGDTIAPNVLVETTDGTTTYATFTNFEGSYQNFIGAEGLLTTSVNPASLPSFFTATPASQNSNFMGFGNEDVINFCLIATEAINDLKISLLPTSQAVPGFDGFYDLVYENVGTTQLNGQVTLLFDENRQAFVEATPAQTTSTAGLITWDYTDLNPFESRSIKVVLNNFPPPANEIGDEIPLRAQVSPIADDAHPADNTSEIKQIVVGAFDPNDKNVMQGSEISEAQVGNYLDYVIRFQNTGNINATTVIIEDLLDTNLQWESLRPLSASHSYRAEIKNGNEVSFIFENIDLPPEMSDPEGSKGYIAFQVRTDDSLIVGDEVHNTASIFFDFNPAIITNTVNTIVVDVEPPLAVCQSITVSLDANGQAVITASDIDNGSNDTNGIASLVLDTTAFDCSNLGANTVTLTVTDTFGNVSECTAVVTVVDDLAPVLACQSIVVSLDENGLAAIDPALLLDMTSTMDNCGIESIGSSVSFVDCDAINAPAAVTVFVEDVNGNIATCQTTISAVDELPPVFDASTLPSDQTKLTDETGVYLLEDFTSTLLANDNCSATVVLVQTPAVGESLAPGVYDITITASDAFSNETEYTFELTVELLLGVDPFSIENKITIYPNPVSEILQIEISNGLFLEKVTIYSIQGEKLLVTSEEKINISSFAKGGYFALIETNQGAITKKIIKN